MLEPSRFRLGLGRGGEDGAERAAEPLRQAERHGVELAPELGGQDAACHGRINGPRPVEMHSEPVPPCLGDDGPQLLGRPDSPPPPLSRVLGADDPARGRVQVTRRADPLRDLLGPEAPVERVDRSHRQAGVHGRAAELVAKTWASASAVTSSPGSEWRRSAIWFAIVAVGTKTAPSCPREDRGSFLELDHGRVLALLLVSNLGLHHGAPHAGCRLHWGCRNEGRSCGQRNAGAAGTCGRARGPPARFERGCEAEGASLCDAGIMWPELGEHSSASTSLGVRLTGTTVSPAMDLTLVDELLTRRGAPAYRTGQVWGWTARGAPGYEAMTNVPAELRAELTEAVPYSTLDSIQEATSKDGPRRRSFAQTTRTRSRPC